MTYQPFLDDRAHIDALEGQRFVVLRMGGPAADEFVRLRERLRAHLPGADVSFPAQPHVTLAGFTAGAPLAAVQEIVNVWSRTVPPLGIELEHIAVFPPPFQIVALQVRRTPALFDAMADLRRRGVEGGLTLSTKVPVEQWVFHVSLVYGAALGVEAWNALEAFTRDLHVTAERDVSVDAEIVAFDGGVECSGGVHRLRGDAWRLTADGAVRLVEGRPDGAWMRTAADANRIVEVCASTDSRLVLLEPTHMTPAFFDLSSGDAGAILQKLRQYGVRLAVVCPPGSARFSSRFGEAVAEERDRGWFGLFETRKAAADWLAAVAD